MKSVYAVLSTFGLVILFAFQNCAQTAPQSTTDLSSIGIQKTPPVQLSASEIYVDQRLANNQTYHDPANFDVQTVSQIEFGLKRSGDYRYLLNLVSGVLHDSSNNTDDTLSADQVEEVLEALTGATLSNRHLLSSEDIYCTMEYSPGYARITTDRSIYILGEGSAGCPKEDLYVNTNSAEIEKSQLAMVLDSLVN